MTKIYTKQGDQGDTCVPITGQVSKGLISVEALGTIDELNCHIGCIIEDAANGKEHIGVSTTSTLIVSDYNLLNGVQNKLFSIGAQLSTGESHIAGCDITSLEYIIDELEKFLKPLTQFILPRYQTKIHLTRAVCRRAERCVIRWRDEKRSARFDDPIMYLNRLSDMLFVFARFKSSKEEYWKK